MVAAFILLVCIAPTMRIFTSMYVEQQEVVRDNQRDHLAHHVHSKITELLYKRELHISGATKGQTVAIEVGDGELNEQMKKLSYACEFNLVVVKSHKTKNQEHPDKFLVKMVIKLKDISPKAQVRAKNGKKTYENQDPTETYYDYYVYIDAGYKAKEYNVTKKDGSEAASENEEDGDDDDDGDEEEFDSDDDDDDDEDGDDDEDDEPARSPLKNTKKPAATKPKSPAGGAKKKK